MYPGQFGCEDSRQCSKGFPGAECDSSRRCVCPHGMQAQQQTCVLRELTVVLYDYQYFIPALLWWAASLSLFPSDPVIPALVSSNVILSDDRYMNLRRSPSNFYSRRRYQQTSPLSGGISPDSVCSVDADCAGYPLAFCDGVCRCVSGALNAGSTCISSGNGDQSICNENNWFQSSNQRDHVQLDRLM